MKRCTTIIAAKASQKLHYFTLGGTTFATFAARPDSRLWLCLTYYVNHCYATGSSTTTGFGNQNQAPVEVVERWLPL